MWSLLTQSDVPKQDEYNKEDLEKYTQILLETDAIYKNFDKNTNRVRSTGGKQYVQLISPI